MCRGPSLRTLNPRSEPPLWSASRTLTMGRHAWSRSHSLLAGDGGVGSRGRAALRHLAGAHAARRRQRRVVGRIEIDRLRHLIDAIALDGALHALTVEGEVLVV